VADTTDRAGDTADPTADGAAPDAVLRRAPFSDNPNVGARGQRTRQAILDAALKVFGDIGYQRCSIDKIAKAAGCSRVSFYQYFSGKEDVFRRLAAQVDRELAVSNERLDPITPDAAGWASVRAWADRYADIYERYEPVFNTFPAAAESDVGLTEDAARLADRYGIGFRARVAQTDLRDRTLDPILEMLRESMTRTLGDSSTLRHAVPEAYPLADVLDAYADVVHRTLFGRLDDVNVHGRPGRSTAKLLSFGPVMEAVVAQASNGDSEPGRDGPTRRALLDAGRRVLVARGYHGTRIDDIAEAAGVAHGAFYRYFKNKEQLAQVLAAEAMRTVSTTLLEIPAATADDPNLRTALRRWLKAYNRAQANETAMIRVWVDAALQDEGLRTDSAAMLDWGRRRMSRFLGGRGFGDPDIDAVVLVALVDAFGVRERSNDTIDAVATIIERGFLGR
jgi:AcrR family transcriptional regulator